VIKLGDLWVESCRRLHRRLPSPWRRELFVLEFPVEMGIEPNRNRTHRTQILCFGLRRSERNEPSSLNDPTRTIRPTEPNGTRTCSSGFDSHLYSFRVSADLICRLLVTDGTSKLRSHVRHVGTRHQPDQALDQYTVHGLTVAVLIPLTSMRQAS